MTPLSIFPTLRISSSKKQAAICLAEWEAIIVDPYTE
jgi:hypothetical protein